MLRYFVNRLLFFIPTLLVISLAVFGLSRLISGDPLSRVEISEERSSGSGIAWRQAEISYQMAARRMGLDRPAFYFTITHAARPDTLYRILHRHRREAVELLLDRYGCRDEVMTYFQALTQMDYVMASVPDSLRNEAYNRAFREFKKLQRQGNPKEIAISLSELTHCADQQALPASVEQSIITVSALFHQIQSNAKPGMTLIPAIYWHGIPNQYHDWMSAFIRGDLGQSYIDTGVAAKIGQALRNTIPLSLLAILLVYLVAVPTGVWSAVHRGETKEKSAAVVLFLLYAIPAFWLAALCIVAFPKSITSGTGALTPDQIALPVLCLSAGSFAFLSRQMKTAMSNALEQDFVRTAIAKGLPFREVVWKHAFKNALFPMITLIAAVLPATVGGSFVIEYVFNINGMGRLLVTSTRQMDWPVVFALVMLSASLTIVGNLIADLLYHWADPRVKWR